MYSPKTLSEPRPEPLKGCWYLSSEALQANLSYGHCKECKHRYKKNKACSLLAVKQNSLSAVSLLIVFRLNITTTCCINDLLNEKKKDNLHAFLAYRSLDGQRDCRCVVIAVRQWGLGTQSTSSLECVTRSLPLLFEIVNYSIYL